MLPKLTACVTTYNRWSICERAIRSVLAQVMVEISLVVVDDCSDERIPSQLLELIESNGGIYIRHSCNKGLAAARNTALNTCKTDWFAFCDDDDQWAPLFSHTVLLEAESNPSASAIFSFALGKKEDFDSKFGRHIYLKDLMLKGITPPVGSQAYKKSVLGCSLKYCEEVKSGVDHDLWINLVYELNPEVAVVWGANAFVGTGCGNKRMTRNRKSRELGIDSSLRIWEEKLISRFGKDFYLHFCTNYRKHISKVFFIDSVRGFRVVEIVKFLAFPDILLFGFKVLVHGNFYKKQCNLFEEFG